MISIFQKHVVEVLHWELLQLSKSHVGQLGIEKRHFTASVEISGRVQFSLRGGFVLKRHRVLELAGDSFPFVDAFEEMLEWNVLLLHLLGITEEVIFGDGIQALLFLLFRLFRLLCLFLFGLNCGLLDHLSDCLRRNFLFGFLLRFLKRSRRLVLVFFKLLQKRIILPKVVYLVQSLHVDLLCLQKRACLGFLLRSIL